MSTEVEIIMNKKNEIIKVKVTQVIHENYVKITNEYKDVHWRVTENVPNN